MNPGLSRLGGDETALQDSCRSRRPFPIPSALHLSHSCRSHSHWPISARDRKIGVQHTSRHNPRARPYYLILQWRLCRLQRGVRLRVRGCGPLKAYRTLKSSRLFCKLIARSIAQYCSGWPITSMGTENRTKPLSDVNSLPGTQSSVLYCAPLLVLLSGRS